MKVTAGVLDKPQIKGMVLQVLTTDRCTLLIPPGCFAFRSCLCHCWWNETVPAAHSGWIWARVHLLQDGTSILTSTFSGVWWVIKNRELDGALFAPLCEEEQNELLMCSSLTELSDPESTRGRRPAVRQTPCSWINVLLVSLQCNGCFLTGHIDICEVQLTLCYTAVIGKKTPSLWVWTSDVSFQDVWNKNHNDGHSEAADFHPGVYSTLLLCPWYFEPLTAFVMSDTFGPSQLDSGENSMAHIQWLHR